MPKVSRAVHLDLSLDVRDTDLQFRAVAQNAPGPPDSPAFPGIVCTAWVVLPSARVLLAQRVLSLCLVAEWYFDVLSSHERHESLLRFFFLLPKRVPGQIDLS